jgi:hypothetical protein
VDAPTKRRTLKQMYADYKPSMVFVEVTMPSGDLSCGSAFHVGHGLVVTARHVVEDSSRFQLVAEESGQKIAVERVSVPKDRRVDLAVLKTDFNLDHYMSRVTHANDERRNSAKTDYIPIGFHLDDWLGDEFVLSKILMMGYPPIPTSRGPVLVATTGTVSAVIDKYTGPHPHFVISPIPRGGFSGGPILSEYGFLLGVLTESLVKNGRESESGFASAVSVEPLLCLLAESELQPKGFSDEEWREFVGLTPADNEAEGWGEEED